MVQNLIDKYNANVGMIKNFIRIVHQYARHHDLLKIYSFK